jgi:hypothetical protein
VDSTTLVKSVASPAAAAAAAGVKSVVVSVEDTADVAGLLKALAGGESTLSSDLISSSHMSMSRL